MFENIINFNDIYCMITVIKGDIVNSRNIANQNKRLIPLKKINNNRLNLF